MAVTAAQRTARARQLLGLGPEVPVVMAAPLGGFAEATDPTPSAAPRGRDRLMAALGLDPARLLLDGAMAMAAPPGHLTLLPLNATRTDFADPVHLPAEGFELRWWDDGGRATLTCRLWLTATDGRWLLLEVPRRSMFLRSRFADGLDELLAATGAQHIDPPAA